MMVNKDTLRGSQRGATMVEFSLVAILLLFIVVTFIDLARIFLVQSLLTKGAQEGLALAEKIDNLSIDNEQLDAADAALYADYTAARNAVVDAATARILAIIAERQDVAPDAPVRLQLFTPVDFFNGTPQVTAPIPALVLRPGDSGTGYGGEVLNHPLRCSTLYSDCTQPRNAWDSMDSMLREFAMQVHLEAVVETYSPWLGDLRLRGQAMGWREVAISSGFDDGVASLDELNANHPPPNPSPGDCTPISCPSGYYWHDDHCECDCLPPDGGCPAGTWWYESGCNCIGAGGS